jgi:hypothetical protein
MSNIYNLTKQIHTNLLKVCEKYGLEKLKIESEKYIYTNSNILLPIDQNTGDYQKLDKPYYPAIQPPQIRQILVHLQGVLGENPEYAETSNSLNEDIQKNRKLITNISINDWAEVECLIQINDGIGYKEAKLEILPKSQAEALCQKWLDGLTPLFDTNPVAVLTELNEVLENLLK